MVTLAAAQLPPRVVDERRTTRKRTLLGGKVIYGEGKEVLDCTIRDLSEKGARIALPKGQCVPTRLFLLDCRTSTVHEARVTWINPPNFGLSFGSAHRLDGEFPPELQFLKTLASERGWR